MFDQARGVYFEYRAELAELQLAIYDGEWDVKDYGDNPTSCQGVSQDDYRFDFGRRTPVGWKLESTPAETADEIMAWLDANDWQKITGRTYSEGISDVVEASRPDSNIETLIIDISPGDAFDGILVTAKTTCQSGNYFSIFQLMTPYLENQSWDKNNLELLPSTEHPNARSSFGYTENGKRRFWPEAP